MNGSITAVWISSVALPLVRNEIDELLQATLGVTVTVVVNHATPSRQPERLLNHKTSNV